jgi:hypothetical protein
MGGTRSREINIFPSFSLKRRLAYGHCHENPTKKVVIALGSGGLRSKVRVGIREITYFCLKKKI